MKSGKFFAASSTMILSIAALLVCQQASADTDNAPLETTGQKIERVATKVKVKVENTAYKVGRGIKKGVHKTGQGVKKATRKTGAKIKQGGEKIQGASESHK